MRVLFIGESWYGSSARSLGEALSRQPGIQLEAIGADLIVPIYSSRLLRAAARLLSRFTLQELKRQVILACENVEPDVIVVVKGWHFDAEFVRSLKRYAPVVNVFTDASPHAHGARLKQAVGEYDLVIARNRQHPPLWSSVYGYSNPCVHVTHAYCEQIHRRDEPSQDQPYDVVMVATGREEYAALLRGVVERFKGRNLKMAVAGNGWAGRGLDNAPGLEFVGVKPGASYADWLRKGKVVIAPVQTILHAGGVQQPGDEVTGRTFQCASAYTFFIHRRTDEIGEFYDEATEAPFYDGAEDLAEKIDYFLVHPEERLAMATAAHARAVPAYSYDARAAEIVQHLRMVTGLTT
jgi:spore maturation protein CgeB